MRVSSPNGKLRGSQKNASGEGYVHRYRGLADSGVQRDSETSSLGEYYRRLLLQQHLRKVRKVLGLEADIVPVLFPNNAIKNFLQ